LVADYCRDLLSSGDISTGMLDMNGTRAPQRIQEWMRASLEMIRIGIGSRKKADACIEHVSNARQSAAVVNDPTVEAVR
jgi:hypothetical protein